MKETEQLRNLMESLNSPEADAIREMGNRLTAINSGAVQEAPMASDAENLAAEAEDEFIFIQSEMAELVDRLDAAVQEYLPNDYHNLKAYLLDPLKHRVLGSESGIMSNDPSLPDLVAKVYDQE